MSKKPKLLVILLCCVAALLVVAVVGIHIYNNADHGKTMNDATVTDYNVAITEAARSYGSIGEQEFILIDTVSKELGKNTDITFRVYQLPDGGDWTAYQNYKVSDVPSDFAPDYVGHGTARLLEGSLEKIVVNVMYVK